MAKIFVIVICLVVAVPAFADRERVELVTTDHADVAANAVIRIEGSTGELNIIGWDQPSVEVSADRYLFEEASKKDKATERLKRLEVVKMASGNGELTITTMRKRESGIHLDYQIYVPRNARLVIRHHIGDVVVTDVEGDIDAKTGSGDIVVQLPETERYSIKARSAFGGVYSDFNESRRTSIGGHQLVQDVAAAGANRPSHRIELHVDIGGISIQKHASPASVVPAGL